MLRSLVLWFLLTIAITFVMGLLAVAAGGFGIGLFEQGLAAVLAALITWWDARRRTRART